MSQLPLNYNAMVIFSAYWRVTNIAKVFITTVSHIDFNSCVALENTRMVKKLIFTDPDS